MNWHWPDWASFIAMGGHGPYVWGAFGVTALGIALELWGLRARRRALHSEIEE